VTRGESGPRNNSPGTALVRRHGILYIGVSLRRDETTLGSAPRFAPKNPESSSDLAGQLLLPVRVMNKESSTPLPPEKEARDSVGSLPSKRLRGPALYSFSLPILNVALNLCNTHVHRYLRDSAPVNSLIGERLFQEAQESLIRPYRYPAGSF